MKSSKAILLSKRFYPGCLYLILTCVLAFQGSVTFSLNDVSFYRGQTEFNPDMILQVGAFRLEQNALALKNRLSADLEKPVIIISEDGYYKVRVSGFKSHEELEKILPSLGLLGIRNFWIFRIKKPDEVQPQVVVISDTILNSILEDARIPLTAEIKPLPPDPGIALQAGVFHSRSKAYRAQRRIMTKLRLPVEIVREWEYYKVIIPGFHTTGETHGYYPRLADMGYPDILLIENYKQVIVRTR